MQTMYETEIVRKVYDNTDGNYVTIEPSPDFPGNVILHVEAKCKEYFGDIRLDMPAEFMRQVGVALMNAAEEANLQP